MSFLPGKKLLRRKHVTLFAVPAARAFSMLLHSKDYAA
jgi:hypothetical protein